MSDGPTAVPPLNEWLPNDHGLTRAVFRADAILVLPVDDDRLLSIDVNTPNGPLLLRERLSPVAARHLARELLRGLPPIDPPGDER